MRLCFLLHNFMELKARFIVDELLDLLVIQDDELFRQAHMALLFLLALKFNLIHNEHFLQLLVSVTEFWIFG